MTAVRATATLAMATLAAATSSFTMPEDLAVLTYNEMSSLDMKLNTNTALSSASACGPAAAEGCIALDGSSHVEVSK